MVKTSPQFAGTTVVLHKRGEPGAVRPLHRRRARGFRSERIDYEGDHDLDGGPERPVDSSL